MFDQIKPFIYYLHSKWIFSWKSLNSLFSCFGFCQRLYLILLFSSEFNIFNGEHRSLAFTRLTLFKLHVLDSSFRIFFVQQVSCISWPYIGLLKSDSHLAGYFCSFFVWVWLVADAFGQIYSVTLIQTFWKKNLLMIYLFSLFSDWTVNLNWPGILKKFSIMILNAVFGAKMNRIQVTRKI
jgi:hypothetical protein